MTEPATTDYEVFYRRNLRRLVAVGTAMTGDREGAQDVAQEALMRAHAAWPKLVTYDDIDGWVKRVAVNLLIDGSRRRSRRLRLRQRRRRSPLPPNMEASVIHADRWRSLVEGLPVRQRAVVVLRYGDDLALAEIASMLDVKEGTIKSDLARARRSIADRLSKEEAHG